MHVVQKCLANVDIIIYMPEILVEFICMCTSVSVSVMALCACVEASSYIPFFSLVSIVIRDRKLFHAWHRSVNVSYKLPILHIYKQQQL